MTGRIFPNMLLCAALLALSAAAHGEDVTESGAADPRALGRTYTQWFYDGAFDRLWARFAPALRSTFKDEVGLRAFARRVADQVGEETARRAERVIPWVGSTIYNRTAQFSRSSDPVRVQWTTAPDGDITGFFVRPARSPAPSRFLDYETKTRLRLPFDGTWFVYWGGRSVVENYHAVARDQRFADDFLIVRDDSTHSGDPARNESHFCFGHPVLAPGAGTVVAAVDGIADNVPGQMNDAQPLGNHVIIDHGNGEFSFLAHLLSGSVAVGTGQAVTPGELLGHCGNSGRSSEPHLHYHMQTTADFGDGDGLPAQFLDYRSDGGAVARGEPTRGETVAPKSGDRLRPAQR